MHIPFRSVLESRRDRGVTSFPGRAPPWPTCKRGVVTGSPRSWTVAGISADGEEIAGMTPRPPNLALAIVSWARARTKLSKLVAPVWRQVCRRLRRR
jgi:hypothetical protein